MGRDHRARKHAGTAGRYSRGRGGAGQDSPVERACCNGISSATSSDRLVAHPTKPPRSPAKRWSQRSARDARSTRRMRLEPRNFDELSDRVYGLAPRIESTKMRVEDALAEAARRFCSRSRSANSGAKDSGSIFTRCRRALRSLQFTILRQAPKAKRNEAASLPAARLARGRPVGAGRLTR